MAATKLILHHKYTRGIAYDFSDSGNHGTVTQAFLQTTGPNSGALRFNGNSGTRVDVRPSTSDDNLREFHIQVRFCPDVKPGTSARLNLVEGDGTWALFVDASLNIGATTRWVDAGPGPISSTAWDGIYTAPNTVTPNVWHTVDYLFDGISHSTVLLDGTVLGERWDHLGPIQPLGAHGITIGHWPLDDRYTFNGWIAEVKIWREDPSRDPGKGLEDCCVEKGWVDQRVEEARRAGWDTDRFLASMNDLTGSLRHAAAKVRGGDQARAGRISDATRTAMVAMRIGQRGAFDQAVAAIQTEIDATLSPTMKDFLGQDILDRLLATPVGMWVSKDDPAGSRAFLQGALDAACLGDLAPPGRDQKPPPEQKVPQPPTGDPDTDAGLPGWAQGQPQPAPTGDQPGGPTHGPVRPSRPGEPVRPLHPVEPVVPGAVTRPVRPAGPVIKRSAPTPAKKRSLTPATASTKKTATSPAKKATAKKAAVKKAAVKKAAAKKATAKKAAPRRTGRPRKGGSS